MAAKEVLEIPPNKTRLELNSFNEAKKLALSMTAEKVNRPEYKQAHFNDVPTIHMSADPSPEELRAFYEECDLHSLNRCSYTMPVKLKDGTRVEVPVTPAEPEDVEDMMHHVVVLDRASDGAAIELLVEDYSGYNVAFRVVYENEDRMKVTWYCFGKHKLPKRFDPVEPIKYDSRYVNLEKVRIGYGIMPEIITFLETFRVHSQQEPSPYGYILLATLFVLLPEGRRFRVIREWNLANLASFIRVLLKYGFPDLIRDWRALSMGCHWLYLAILEKKLLLALPGSQALVDSEAMDKAAAIWSRRQRLHACAGLFFYEDGVDMDLGSLAGGELFVLRHDHDLCTKVLMRYINYAGDWEKEIKVVVSEIPQGLDE